LALWIAGDMIQPIEKPRELKLVSFYGI